MRMWVVSKLASEPKPHVCDLLWSFNLVLLCMENNLFFQIVEFEVAWDPHPGQKSLSQANVEGYGDLATRYMK